MKTGDTLKESGCICRTFELSKNTMSMRLITRLQELAIKTILICFMIIVAIPAKGINYVSESIKRSSRTVKAFLIITIILTGEFPQMTQGAKAYPPGIRLVVGDYENKIN